MLKEFLSNVGIRTKSCLTFSLVGHRQNLCIDKQAETSSSIRQQIDNIFEKYPQEWWDYLPTQISVLSGPNGNTLSKDKKPLVDDCKTYVFGKDTMEYLLQQRFPWKEVDIPNVGDFVYYVKDRKVLHVGAYEGRMMVRSKWGVG